MVVEVPGEGVWPCRGTGEPRGVEPAGGEGSGSRWAQVDPGEVPGGGRQVQVRVQVGPSGPR